MKLTNNEKRQLALDLTISINGCESVDECEMIKDQLDEFVDYDQIFKKDYRALSKKLNSRICYLTERGYV